MCECGLRWDDAGAKESWADIYAVLVTEGPWGPLNRALKGKDWAWFVPGFDQLVTIFEAVKEGNYISAHKDPKKFKRIDRPWSKSKRKLVGKVMPIKKFDEFFESRFSQE